MANFIKDDTFDLIVNLIGEGHSIRKIAALAGVSKNTVKPIIRDWHYFHKTENKGYILTPKGGYWAHKKHGKKRKKTTFRYRWWPR